MQLQPNVKKEVVHIGTGCAVGTVVLVVGWALASALGAPFGFSWKVPLSAVLGAFAAWLNFFGLALTLQKMAAGADEARGRSLMRTSELYRKLGLGLFLIAMFLIPAFNWVAATIPLLFPQVTIFVMYALRRKPSQNKGGES